MQNPFNHPAWIDISLLLSRLVLGLYVLLAGWSKMAGGMGKFVDGSFKSMTPQWLPEAVARPYGYLIPIGELLLGLMLILGLFSRIAAGLMTLLLLSIVIAMMNKNGVTGLADAGGPPFHHAFVMLPMAFMLAIIGSGRLALDPLYFAGGAPEGGGGKKK